MEAQDMFEPCYEHCYLRYGMEYTTECDNKCNYAKAMKRLAYYEDLEKQGRLIVLSVQDIHPCRNCGVGWGHISSDGCKSCHDTCARLKNYESMFFFK